MIQAIKTFIAAYTGIESDKPIYVDKERNDALYYSIDPLPGAKTVKKFVDGGEIREYPFAFIIEDILEDEASRIALNQWSENFSEWLESQTKAHVLPILESGKKAQKIEATNWGYLYETDNEGEKGKYYISCRLEYQI